MRIENVATSSSVLLCSCWVRRSASKSSGVNLVEVWTEEPAATRSLRSFLRFSTCVRRLDVDLSEESGSPLVTCSSLRSTAAALASVFSSMSCRSWRSLIWELMVVPKIPMRAPTREARMDQYLVFSVWARSFSWLKRRALDRPLKSSRSRFSSCSNLSRNVRSSRISSISCKN